MMIMLRLPDYFLRPNNRCTLLRLFKRVSQISTGFYKLG